MSMRKDPALVAAEITVFLRELALRMGGHQVCTVGKIDLHPNLINVVPARAILTLDVRNTDEQLLVQAEKEISDYLAKVAAEEQVSISTRPLARFEPVQFADSVINMVHEIAKEHGHTVRYMPSGAGHDAQMLARVCPSGMIFVQSRDGISHNAAEYTSPEDIEAGSNILLHSMLQMAQSEETFA